VLHAGAVLSAGDRNARGFSVPKILVADDNTNIQKMVSLALEERGISVVSVGNGEAAVRRIPDVDPDLVLADIFMPVRNGYEVCEFIKKNDRFAHVPVILLVGAFDPLDEKEARRVGADGVLKKPFVPPDPLIAMVTSALEKNPRVAAEIAKAKEAKVPAPPPDPLPSVGLSSRPEPKPLPEFPEPSPEEAELAYGMVKASGALDSTYEGEPAGPVAIPRQQSADEEELDSAATASDWRRSAMDFEIPADIASKPAMPSLDELDPITFPSEQDYPPRHVSAPEAPEEVPPAAKNEAAGGSSSFSLRQVEDSEAAEEPPANSPAVPAALRLQVVSDPQPPMGVHPAGPAANQPDALPEPNSTAPGGHWLDVVATAQAEHLSSGWMDSLNSQQPEAPNASTGEPHPINAKDQAGSEMIDAEPAAPSEPITYAGSPLERDDAETEPQAATGDDHSFFADDPEIETDTEPSPVPHQESGVLAGASEPAGRDIELDADDSAPPLAFKDPALVEPPAVHVRAEPLLVDEDSGAFAEHGAGASAGQTAPVRSIFAPAPEIPAASAEFSVQAPADAAEPAGEEVNERIPTMPPPNREALSHIPFLTPPPSFLAELNQGAQPQNHAADPATVDTVVQKVLEKLQPQLQELLSQGLLKPLVESILQNEVTKK
jgi:CheY-like chemotaxis protein